MEEEANTQLLIMNEANMFELFKKRNMPIMKRLTEGYGQAIENKFVQPFTGFVGSYQLITCNYLVCPFVEPAAPNSGLLSNCRGCPLC